MRRRAFITLLGSAAAWPLLARAQQAGNPRLIGFLYPGPIAAGPPRVNAFLTGLRSGGVREPDEVEIVARIADGDLRMAYPTRK